MTRLLSQLACGGCGDRFWPPAEPFATWVHCPSCGAAHPKPDAIGQQHHRVIAHTDAEHELVDWLDRHWIGEPHLGMAVRVEATEASRVDGFEVCIARCRWQPYAHGPAIAKTVAWVAADTASARLPLDGWRNLPHGRSEWRAGRRELGHAGSHNAPLEAMRRGEAVLPVDPCWNSVFTSSGAVLFGFTYDFGACGQLAQRLVAEMRGAGAQPTHPLVEVPDPQPIDPAAIQPDGSYAAHAVRCDRCGAPSQLESLPAGQPACAHCSEPLRVDGEARNAIERYRRRIDAHRQAMQLALEPGRLWTSVRAPTNVVQLACCNCGGPSAHQPGRMDERCGYCQSLLLPPEPALSASASAHHAAAGAQVVAARRRHEGRELAYRRWRRSEQVWLPVAGLVLAAFAIAALTAFFAMQPGGAAAAMVYPCLLGGFVGLASLGFLALAIRRRRQTARWRRRYEAIAEQLGAQRVGNLELLDQWLETEWRDVLPIGRFGDAPSEACVTAVLTGYPSAIEAEPQPRGSRRFLARAFVAVAAALPPDAPYWLRIGAADALAERIRACGFTVELHAGGVLVKATPETVQRIATQPDLIVALGPIASIAATLTSAVGGLPRAAQGA